MTTICTIAVALAFTCGCSLIATRSTPRDADNTCGSYVPPVIDALITAAVIAVTVNSYRENRCDRADGCHSYDPTGLYALAGIPFAISTAVGFSGESTCRSKLKPG